jgi:hypothetical protein
LAVVYIEKGHGLLKENGKFGHIVTYKYMVAEYGEGIRKVLTDNSTIDQWLLCHNP